MTGKTVYSFQFHKTFYTIKIDYSPKKRIKITIEANISDEIYFIRLYQQKLPIQLAFYESIDNLYLALSKSQELAFNISQKCFQFSDLINNKPTKISLKLRKRKISLSEANKKIALKSKSNKQQEQQLRQLKLRYQQAEKNIENLIMMVKQGQKELLLQHKQLQAERRKIQEISMQNQQLRKYCRFYKRRFPNFTKEFDIFMKRRKGSDTSCSKIQISSPLQTKQMIVQGEKISSEIQIKSINEQQQSLDSFLLQVDEEQFSKAMKSKK